MAEVAQRGGTGDLEIAGTVAPVASAGDPWRRALLPGPGEAGGGAGLLRALLLLLAGAAVYGGALGGWTGPRLALYAALKLPLVLVLTAALTFAFNALAAPLLGARLSSPAVAHLTLAALATAAVLLAALAPMVVLFDLSLEPPTPEARLTHNLLYLLHTAAVAAAGLVGVGALWRRVVALVADTRVARRLVVAWVLALALTGGEVAWALRPFVGSVYADATFLRRDALDGNVYELIFTDILPFLAGGPEAVADRGDREEGSP